MLKRSLCIFAILLFLSGAICSCKIELARANSVIYIRADGSIEPSSSPISTSDNKTYILTSNISSDVWNCGIVVERNNTVIDGNGYMLQGSSTRCGIQMTNASNVIIKNINIGNFSTDININFSYNITVTNNNLSSAHVGVNLYFSFDNVISNNNLTGEYGLGLVSSSDNIVSCNSITRCEYGIVLQYSSNNTVIQNSFTGNDVNIELDLSPSNRFLHNNLTLGSATNGYTKYQIMAYNSTQIWDNGFEGNYWSDYNGIDNNQDGIGDTPYVADANNIDHYPLMGTFQSFNVSAWNISVDLFEEVTVISNSTIEKAELFLDQGTSQYPWHLDFTVHGQNGTIGFCRITFPSDMLNSSTYPIDIREGYIIKIPTQIRIIESNGTHTTVYFTYNQTLSDYNIDIFPEFPSFLILPLFMIATMLAIVIYKRRILTRAL